MNLHHTQLPMIAVAAMIVVGLSGCASVGARQGNSAPTPTSSARSAPGMPAYPPSRSGSNDEVTGRLADNLVARVTTLPPRTSAVADAPLPALAKPMSSLGCGEAQRTLFWVATGWTPNALAGWVREHPVAGLVVGDSDADALNAPVVRQLLVTKGPKGSADQLISFRFLAMDGGRVGVAVEAEVGPSNPCKHTTGGDADGDK